MKGEAESHRLGARSARVDLQNCDQEPIPTPSAIQPHGVLLAMRRSDFRVVYASANVCHFFSFTAGDLLGSLLPDAFGKELLDAVTSLSIDEKEGCARRLTVHLPGFRHTRFYASAHRIGELVCVEIEPAVKEPSRDHLSTQAATVMENLLMARTSLELCAAAARELRKLSGYDTVMIYRFHGDEHDEVIAEDKESGIPPFLHLHLAASEIPEPTGCLYLQQRSRQIPDAACQPALVLADAELSQGLPLDMTYCGLRSVSPIHLQHMKNTGVGASFSISLIHRQKLWGVALCHHRTARLMPPEIRLLCELLGQMLSSLLDVTLNNEHSEEQLANEGRLNKLSKRMPPGALIAEVLQQNTVELLGAAGASGAILQLQGHTRLAGATPSMKDSISLMNAVRNVMANGIVAYSSLKEILPDFAHLSLLAAGGLMIAIGDSPDDCVFWLRPEIEPSTRGGGDPDRANSRAELSGRFMPRGSSKAWRDKPRGHSRQWREIDFAMVRDFERMLTVTMLRHADLKAQLSNVDSLTKLPNRRVLLDRLASLQKAQSPNKAGLIFLDIDRFKIVNDTLGHAAGDDLLIQVARRLTACTGGDHLVARMGGDEFVVFCEDTLMTEAETVARGIVESFQDPFLLNGKPFRCATSVGLAPMGGGLVGSIADILHSADSAMYAAKRLGGNRVVVFEKPLREELMRQIQLEQDLFLAIEREEMTAHFQPQISVVDNKLIGFEALLRWVHPIYGDISPAEFIPMAERSGHIGPVGLWALKESLRLIGRWRRRYLHDLFVAVNVSSIQLAASDFADRVREALEATRMPAEALHLEVTESNLIEPSAEAQLRALQALGVKIAIDDFGTGYSSLAYLQRLSISELKLDSTFLADVGKDERKTTLFGSIVSMAHTLKLGVIAEGVEESGQLQCIRACDCDAAQGYLFSKAIPADRVEAMLFSGWHGGALPLGDCGRSFDQCGVQCGCEVKSPPAMPVW
jgi:diguanylate cyclase (GGDEF)-like protein